LPSIHDAPQSEHLRFTNPPFRFREICLVNFEPDKFFHSAALRRDGRVSNSQEWIEHRLDARRAVQFDAPFRQLHWKSRRMRALFLAALDRFIGNEPSIAATTQIASASVTPARNVAFVLIRYSDGEPIELDAPGFSEMKNVLMTVV